MHRSSGDTGTIARGIARRVEAAESGLTVNAIATMNGVAIDGGGVVDRSVHWRGFNSLL